MELLTEFANSIWITFTNPEPSAVAAKILITVLILLVITVVTLTLVYSVRENSGSNPRVTDQNIALAIGKRREALDKMPQLDGQNSFFAGLLPSIPEQERYLVNLCPLTASIGGYSGPVENGVFDSEYYLRKALRAGIRSFILPISTYYDDTKQPPRWPYSGSPAIVYRAENGKILSLNGLSIKKFCENLLIYKSDNNPQIEEPILITLHEVDGYVPDKIKAEKEYVQLMSKIAKELEPLNPVRLTTLGPYGSAVGGQREMEILTQVPIPDLRNKVLIFTTFDPKIALKDAYNSIQPRLYDYVNFISKPVVAENAGTPTTVGSRVIRLMDVKGSKINWTDQARTVWHSTGLDAPNRVPEVSDVDAALKTGIQSITIPFYTVDTDKVKPIWDVWGGYAWRVKPPTARYAKPLPIVPQKPSTALNARVDSTLQPGQTKFN
jgi:hypothetical protein